MSKSFDEIQKGDTVSFTATITEELHKGFARLSGDESVIHTDPDFGTPLGYAFLLTSFLSRLYGELLPGGTSICIKQEVQFVKPYFIGDEIRIVAEVVDKIESTRFCEIKVSMYRPGDECILRGKGVVQVNLTPDDITPLYSFEGHTLYKKDFVNALRGLGITQDDLLFVHADIASFGKLISHDRNRLLHALVGALTDVAKTIIMPTFTYSFCKNEPYDPDHSPSTVGTLTEYFRKLPSVVRTLHPIFSVAILGDPTLVDVGKDSFDKNSIFARLHKKRGKILFFGAPFQSCTFIHYIEQMYGVPYRYMKTFEGTIKTKEGQYKEAATYFVRYLDKKVDLDLKRLGKHLLNQGIMKKSRVGEGDLLLIDAEALFEEGQKMLKQDLYFFLREKPEITAVE